MTKTTTMKASLSSLGLAMLIASGSASAIGFKVPGTETTLNVGGYAKLDMIYNDKTVGNNSQANIELTPGSIPIEGTEEGENEIQFNGRESRLWVKTSTPTSLGALKTHLEFDFDTNEGNQVVSNSHGARIRHAYGTLGNVLAGRTWSTFMILDALPETSDFGGPVGATFVRQAQFRYTMPFEGGSFQFAMENAETFVNDVNGKVGVVDDDKMPDFIARINMNNDWGNFAAAALLRKLNIDEGSVNDSATTIALSVGGKLKLQGKDNLKFQLTGGKGVGRYANLATFRDGNVDGNGKLEGMSSVQGFVAYQHWWSENLRSTLAFGYAAADNEEYMGASKTKNVSSIHANLMWNQTKQLRYGLEYIRGDRELESGAEGDLNRIMFSARYMF